MPVHLKFIVGLCIVLSVSISARLLARDITSPDDNGECPDGYIQYDEGSCETRKSRYELSVEYSKQLYEYLDRKSTLASKLADIELEFHRLGVSVDAEGEVNSNVPKTDEIIALENEWQPLLAEHKKIDAEYKKLDAEQEKIRSELY